MSYLWASNNIADFTNISKSTNTSYFDSARVPYGLLVPDESSYSQISNHPISSTSTTWYHFRIYNSSVNAAAEDGYWWKILDLNGKHLHRWEINNGTYSNAISGDGVSWSIGSYSTALSVGYHDIDIMIDVVAGTVSVDLYVDQVLHVSGNRTITNSGSLEKAGSIVFESWDASATSSAYIVSEIIVSETDTRGLRLNMLRPTAAGNHTAWDGLVADIHDDDSVTGMHSATANQRQSFSIGTYSGGSIISAVLAVSNAIRDTSGPQNFKHFLRKSATDYDGSSVTLDTSSTFVVEEWAVDPSDTLAWVSGDLTGLELGVQSLA